MQHTTEKTLVEGIKSLQSQHYFSWTDAQHTLAQELHEASEKLLENDDWIAPAEVHWLWDLLDPTDGVLPVRWPKVDVADWSAKVEALLERYWGQYEAFAASEGAEEDGPAMVEASQLHTRFELGNVSTDGLTFAERVALYRLFLLLEHHIDPEGIFEEARFKQWEAEGIAVPESMRSEDNGLSDCWDDERMYIELLRLGVRWYEKTGKPEIDDDPVKRKWLNDPKRELKVTMDWIERGRPDNDAPVVRINGQTVQADVGKMIHSGVEDLYESGVGGSALTMGLWNLATQTGQPFHSVRKTFDEFCGGMLDRDEMASVLDEMLKGDEPLPSVEQLAGSEFTQHVVDDFQRQFDCDEMLVLLAAMTALGTVLPLNTRVRGLSHTNHLRPGILFSMILVPSGGMKSHLSDSCVEQPLVGGVVGATVDAYVAEANRAWKAKQDDPDFRSPHQWINDWLASAACEPVQKIRHMVSDFTGEGLDRNAQLNELFPGFRIGTLLTTDEGRQLMGGDRYKQGNSGSKYTQDKLKRAYDGKGPNALRGNKALERNYDKIRLGILAFIQPEIYDEIAGDESDDACGFWPRFLAYESKPVQLREGLSAAERREIARESTFKKYLGDLYGAAFSLHLISLHFRQEVMFAFSEEAEDWWYGEQCSIGRESEREASKGDPVLARLLAKLPGQTVDFALLLHLIKLFGSGAISTKLLEKPPSTTELEAMRKALPKITSIPVETVQASYNLCRGLMSRTVRQRNRAQGDGSGDREQFLIKVQATAMKYDPDQKGLPIGKLQKGWNGAYLKKHPETKDLIYLAVEALADKGLGSLQAGSAKRAGFRYTWQQAVI